MSTIPLVSVIITTYNRAEHIESAIESVLDQTLQDFEIIIVDDDSTDATIEVVNELMNKDQRIALYVNSPNSGGAARPKNIGLSQASGTYIATLDSDDVWDPRKLEVCVNVLEKSEGTVGFAVSHYKEQVGDTEVVRTIPAYSNPFMQILTRDYLGSGTGTVYKREVFDIVGDFEEGIKSCQDWDMRIRLLEQFDLVVIPEPLVTYVIHENNISVHSQVEKREKDIDFVMNKYAEIYDAYPKARALQKRYIGTWYMMNGHWKKGVVNLFMSLIINPFVISTYGLLLLSLGGPAIYELVNKTIRNL